MPDGGNSIARIMAQLGINFEPAETSTNGMIKKIQALNAEILNLQKTATKGVTLSGGASGAAQSAKDMQTLAYAERARAQAALNDAKAIQTANAPLLQQSKQAINLANEELILTKARGQYIKDAAEAGKRQAATSVINAKQATEAAREDAIVQKTRGQYLRDSAAATLTNAKATTENARETLVSAQANRAEAQALSEVEKRTLMLAQAKKAEASAALTMAKAEQVATGQTIKHAAAQKGLYDRLYNTSTMIHHMNWLASGVLLFGAFETAKAGIVDYEKYLANLTTTLPQLHGNMVATNAAGQSLLKTTERYGVNLEEVANSARSVSRLYKETATVLGLVDQITLLNVIDNVNLDNATKGLETTMVSFGKTMKTNDEILSFSMSVIDKITTLTHNAFAKGDDLVQILQRSASAAKVAGMELNELLAIGTTALRSTGLPGGNVGNFLKTIIGTLAAPTDKVKESLKEIGVSATDAVGKIRPVYDIILDISKATGDAQYSQEELTGAIEATSRGIFQWAKLAAVVGNYEEIIRTSALQLNAQGQTAKMASQQLDTLSRKATTLKNAMIDLWAGVGDNKLRDDLKATVGSITQFIFGLKSAGTAIVTVGGLYLGFGLALKILTGIYGTASSAVTAYTNVKKALTAATVVATAAETAETVAASRAAVATTAFTTALKINPLTAAVTIGFSLLSAALIAYTYNAGKAEKATIDLSAAQKELQQTALQEIRNNQDRARWLEKMAGEHEDLSKAVNSGRLSDEEKAAALSKLKAVENAVISVLSDEEKAIISRDGISKKSINIIADAIRIKQQEAITTNRAEIDKTNSVVTETQNRIQAYNTEIGVLQNLLAARGAALIEKAKELAGDEGFKVREYGMSYRDAGMGDIVMGTDVAEEDVAADIVSEKMDALRQNTGAANTEIEKQIQHVQDLREKNIALADSLDGINHAAGGGGDDKDSGGGGYGTGLRESANQAKLAMDEYNNAIQLTDTYLQGITTRESILNNTIERQKIPTMEQEQQKYVLLSDKIYLYLQKQEQLHQAANAARTQLAPLEAQMASLVAQHEAGTLSTKNFNTAVGALRPEINSLNKSIADYGNAWWDAEGAIKSAQQEFAKVKEEFNQKYLDNATKLMNHEVAMARMSTEEQIKYLRDIYVARQWNEEQTWQLQEERFKEYRKGLDEEMDAIKEAYDERLKQIEDEIDAEKEASQAKVDNKETEIKAIEDETNAQIAAIQELMDALEGEGTQSDREEAEREHNQKMADLLTEKQYHELRTGIEHQDAIADIEKQMAEEDHAWGLKKQEWARSDQKDQYQDQIDAIREQAKTRQDAIKDEIDDIKKASDTKKKELEDYYKDVQKLLSDKNLDMLASLATTDEQWYNRGIEWMKQLAQGIRDGSTELPSGAGDFISGAKDKYGSGGSGSGSSGGSSGSTTKNPSDMTYQELLAYYPTHKAAAEAEIARAGSVYSQNLNAGNIAGARAAHKWADQIRKAIGKAMIWDDMTESSPSVHNSYKKGGPILYDQDARVHAGEYVLTAEVVDAIRLMKPLPTDLGARMASAGSGGGSGGVSGAGSVELIDRAADRIISAILNSPRVVQFDALLRADNIGYSDSMDADIHSRSLARAAKSVLAAKGA